MKRFFFSAITLMVAATACTESGLIDTPEFYQNAIVFDTYVGKAPITKAISYSETELQKSDELGGGVQIYAFYQNPITNEVDFSEPFLNGKLFHISANNTGSWKYFEGTDYNNPVDAYWPGDYKLAFAGYSLNVASDTYISNISDDKTLFDFTVNDNVANQVDLLVTPFTTVTENDNGDTPVSLVFKHILSKVGFKVQSQNSSGAEIQIKSIKLHGTFPIKGRVNLTNSSPSISPITEGTGAYTYEYSLFSDNTKTNFTVDSEECYDTPRAIYEGSTETNRHMMIIPGPQSSASIEVWYKLDDESTFRYATVPLANTWNFEAGKAYEFILQIATATIDFSATVVPGDWNSPAEPELN